MSRQWKAISTAVCVAALVAGCAGGPIATQTAARRQSSPAAVAPVELQQSPALLAFVRAAQEQIAAHCDRDRNRAEVSIASLRQLELEIPVDEHGQLAAARVLRGSGDAHTDRAALSAVAAVRYLPALSADLADQRVMLHWRLAAGTNHCETVSVRVSSRPVRPAQALSRALARGHYQRAQEIVLQVGPRADVLRVLRQALQTRRAQHVALAVPTDASWTPVETLLAQVETLDQP